MESMKKSRIAFLILILIFSYPVFAQKSPVHFLNNTCTINVDTSYGRKYVNTYLIELKFKFVNTGEHVVFIDSAMIPSCITKPHDTNRLDLKFENFFKFKWNYGNNFPKKDTSSSIRVPFYYEGKTYYEKIICKYVYAKSKLIEFGNPKIKVTDSVARFFPEDNNDTLTRKYPGSIIFDVLYPVKNISNAPVWCTKSMVGWHDTPLRNENRNSPDMYILIPPHTTYNIPVQMRLASKYRFNKSGYFVVFSDDTFETHEINVYSDYEPKGCYKYK
jgi:hypothetical protein